MPEEVEQRIGFELSLSARDDGTIEAAYVRCKPGKIKETREIIENTLLADYDAENELIGLEILAPVKLSSLASLVESARRRSFRRFIKRAAPRELVSA